jgi:predicted AlkP superfamily pyrophosphatase or phosphodiesterase
VRNDQLHDPTLTFIYLPHLDYNLQRYGLDFSRIGNDLKEIDGVVRQLIKYYTSRQASIILLSEYGITNVNRPVHLNRILREAGLLAIREERGLELLDAGASKAFAVADHQLAHIYINDPEVRNEVRRLVENVTGVEQLLEGEALARAHLKHDRSGDLVAVADATSWFTYYFWLDDRKAPDYARMVDIHKKPGYDPVEMFTDPADPMVIPKIAGKLLSKKLGFRTVMNVIPLKAELVRGSHGRIPEEKDDYPVLYSNASGMKFPGEIEAVAVRDIISQHLRAKG